MRSIRSSTAMMRLRLPRPLAAAVVLVVARYGAADRCIYAAALRGTRSLSSCRRRRKLRRTLERDRNATATAISRCRRRRPSWRSAADAAAAPAAAPAGVQRVQVEEPPFSVSEYLKWGSVGAGGRVRGQIVLVLFLVFFLLASGDLYRAQAGEDRGPSLAKKKITVQILDEIDTQIERFLLVRSSRARRRHRDMAGVPLDRPSSRRASGAARRRLQLDPVLRAGGRDGRHGGRGVPPVRHADDGAVVVGARRSRSRRLEGFLLTPWLTSRTARMNAVAIFVGLMFWGWVWGVWGMLLAVPMLVVLKAVCDHVEDLKGVGELLGE